MQREPGATEPQSRSVRAEAGRVRVRVKVVTEPPGAMSAGVKVCARRGQGLCETASSCV